jgi:cation diffusion facilitator CzcD-associated flavoprotein CzcO
MRGQRGGCVPAVRGRHRRAAARGRTVDDEARAVTAELPDRTQVLVIGMGQAGLSAAHHLRRRGFDTEDRLLLVDENPGPGGAWQHRWPSLTLETTNRVSDLPGWGLRDALDVDAAVPAAQTVPRYYGRYERRYGLRVHRPVTVERVAQPGGPGTDFHVTLAAPGGSAPATVRARAVVSATGTWDRPRRPYVPGLEGFHGRVLHSHDYTRAEDFRGARVLVIGGGISAIQHIEELASVAEVYWAARPPPRHPRGGVHSRVRAGGDRAGGGARAEGSAAGFRRLQHGPAAWHRGCGDAVHASRMHAHVRPGGAERSGVDRDCGCCPCGKTGPSRNGDGEAPWDSFRG